MDRRRTLERRRRRVARSSGGHRLPQSLAHHLRPAKPVHGTGRKLARPGAFSSAPAVWRVEMTALDRALGAFFGLALGDALGMPTQSLSRAEISARFGAITDLPDARPHPPTSPKPPQP